MGVRYSFSYAIINKSTCRCFQVIATETPNWSIDNDDDYSLPINPTCYSDYLNKYYYDGQWWVRKWSEVDENGEPVEGAVYADYPLTNGG